MQTITSTPKLSLAGTSLVQITDAAGDLNNVTVESIDTNIARVGGTAFALGQATMAASLAVTMASNQSMIPVQTWGPSSSQTRIATNATTVVKSGSGFLRRMVKSKGGTVTMYDNTAASGTIIHSVDGTNPQGTLVYDVPFSTGLTIVTTSGPDILVVYD